MIFKNYRRNSRRNSLKIFVSEELYSGGNFRITCEKNLRSSPTGNSRWSFELHSLRSFGRNSRRNFQMTTVGISGETKETNPEGQLKRISKKKAKKAPGETFNECPVISLDITSGWTSEQKSPIKKGVLEKKSPREFSVIPGKKSYSNSGRNSQRNARRILFGDPWMEEIFL